MHYNSDQEKEEEILIKQEKIINREIKYLLSYYIAKIKTSVEVYLEIEKYKVIAKEKLKIE